MRRAAFLLALALSPCVVGQCAAQNFTSTVPLTPTIQLSADEMAAAKRITENLQNARDRAAAAEERWEAFRKIFRQAHPELPNPFFSSDFVAAYDVLDSHSWVPTATVIELTADERRDAQALYDELKASDEAVKSARKSWEDFQNELVVKHVQGVVPKRAGIEAADVVTIITLPDGKQYIVPSPWWQGIALTPDFRTAVPR
jgi:pantothenate synthetase